MVITLHSFDGTDGLNPNGGLVLSTDGNFYGTTSAGGANGDGTIFKITPGGTLTTLHNFDGTDGANANSVMLQATNGTFYGTTYAGGTSGNGTVFSLSTGLRPFVSFLPATRPVGGVVEILGQGFTGATRVSFNGNYRSLHRRIRHLPDGRCSRRLDHGIHHRHRTRRHSHQQQNLPRHTVPKGPMTGAINV